MAELSVSSKRNVASFKENAATFFKKNGCYVGACCLVVPLVTVTVLAYAGVFPQPERAETPWPGSVAQFFDKLAR